MAATTTTTTTTKGSKEAEKDPAAAEGFFRRDGLPEQEAPDGGWGWMIVLGMTLMLVSSIGPATCFTIVFGDFLTSTGQAGSATTLVNSVFMISFSFSGLLTNSLLKKYTMRSVGLIGALIFAISTIFMAFVRHVYEMAGLSFLQGIGLGFMLTICNTNFNAYFVKRRTTVMSTSQVGIGLIGISYPLIVEKFMKEYGFRGTAALTGALSLNCVAAMLMMHPVEWHFPKARKSAESRRTSAVHDEARKLQVDHVRKYAGNSVHERRHSFGAIKANPRWASLRSLKDGSHEVSLLVETLKTWSLSPSLAPSSSSLFPARTLPQASQSRAGSHADVEKSSPLRAEHSFSHDALNQRMFTLSASSMSNITGLGAVADVQHQVDLEIHGSKGERSRDFGALLADFFEVSLLKNMSFLNTCLGISFAFTSDFTFSTFLPLMMSVDGYSTSDAARAITVSLTAELVSKIFLAFFTMLVKVRAKYLFFVAMILMVFVKLAYLVYSDTLMGTFVTIAAIGAVRSWLLVPQPLVIVEDMPVEKFAAAYGVFSIVSGVISIVCGPIIGFIKDLTNSFALCQYILIGVNATFVVPWALEFVFAGRERPGRLIKDTGEEKL